MRGFSKIKRRSETPDERKSRLCGYAKDIKLYNTDTKKNSDAKRRFKEKPYYLKGVKNDRTRTEGNISSNDNGNV